ncbi:MAG: hypothetical protein ABG776_00030 [Cyanobacteria bacterium J06555_13]
MSNTRKLPPRYTRKQAGIAALLALLGGSVVGLGLCLIPPRNPLDSVGPVTVSPFAEPSEAVISFDAVVVGPAMAAPTKPNPSQSTHELAADVTLATEGTAFDLATNGAVADIDPHKSQATQGIDDGSGLIFPCVFDTPGGEVCQRQLTVDEVTARGF